MYPTYNFQWQNPILLTDIYPMRLQKLRDVLLFYKEADLWAEYKNKNIADLAADVKTYEAGMTAARALELPQYTDLKAYFQMKDVRTAFRQIQLGSTDEALAWTQRNHDVFITSWPNDIAGERGLYDQLADRVRPQRQLGFLRDRGTDLEHRPADRDSADQPKSPPRWRSTHAPDRSAMAMRITNGPSPCCTIMRQANRMKRPQLAHTSREPPSLPR